MIEEIFLCGVVVISNEQSTVLKHHLIADDYKDQTVDGKTKKDFMTNLLTTVEWSKDASEDAL